MLGGKKEGGFERRLLAGCRRRHKVRSSPFLPFGQKLRSLPCSSSPKQTNCIWVCFGNVYVCNRRGDVAERCRWQIKRGIRSGSGRGTAVMIMTVVPRAPQQELSAEKRILLWDRIKILGEEYLLHTDVFFAWWEKGRWIRKAALTIHRIVIHYQTAAKANLKGKAVRDVGNRRPLRRTQT